MLAASSIDLFSFVQTDSVILVDLLNSFFFLSVINQLSKQFLCLLKETNFFLILNAISLLTQKNTVFVTLVED